MPTMTHAMTLELPEQVYETLVKMAKRKGQHPEAVAVQWLVTATEGMVDDPFEQLIGAFSSNMPDWADRHDDYIGQGLMVQLRDDPRVIFLTIPHQDRHSQS